MGLYIISCVVLILFVLLQPGKGDATAVLGGGVNSAAFGPRGTQTVLAKITIGAAITFFLIAFLFSIPGLFEKRSLGEQVGPAESAPIMPTIPAPGQEPPATTAPIAVPETTPTAPADTKKDGSNAQPKAPAGAKPDTSKPEQK
jgi:preprotein translocase subunit SecG